MSRLSDSRVACFASRTHFADHLAPIWSALPDAIRGPFCARGRAEKRARQLGIPVVGGTPRNSSLVMVASYEDYRSLPGSRIIFVNHGSGQTYSGISNSSFSGGPNRERTVLFLEPSERVADISRAAYPDIPAVAIGCPKLDKFHNDPPKSNNAKPVIAVTVHSDSHAVPETRWHLPAFDAPIAELAKSPDYTLLGHSHPRMHSFMRSYWKTLGVEYEPDASEVMRRADCLIFENSSLGYEMASLDKPVIVLSPPWYRRDVEHELRFWSHLPGLHVESPDDLFPAIPVALADPYELKLLRRRAVSYAYAYTDGHATDRAVNAISDLLAARV